MTRYDTNPTSLRNYNYIFSFTPFRIFMIRNELQTLFGVMSTIMKPNVSFNWKPKENLFKYIICISTNPSDICDHCWAKCKCCGRTSALNDSHRAVTTRLADQSDSVRLTNIIIVTKTRQLSALLATKCITRFSTKLTVNARQSKMHLE